MGELRTLGREGDVKMVWDPEVKAEVDEARATFDKMRKKGYFAYAVAREGDKGKVIRTFDPNAAKIILAMPMQGG